MKTTPTTGGEAPSPEAEALPTLPVVAWSMFGTNASFISAEAKDANSECKWAMFYTTALTPLAPAEAAIVALRAEVAELRKDLADARKTARQHFLHEHGSELNDAKHWAEWIEAQRMIEEDMPEGYRVILECSPGDWSLRLTDPDGEDIQHDDYDSTTSFLQQSVELAKEHEAAARASLLGDGGTL